MQGRGSLVQKIKHAQIAVMNCVGLGGSAPDKSLFKPLFEFPIVEEEWLAEVQDDKKEVLSL